MKFGIPIIPLLLVGGVGTFISFLINPLLLFFVGLILYAMRWATAIDDQIFHQMYLHYFLNQRRNGNRVHWKKVISFSPASKGREIISDYSSDKRDSL